jgi:hypothetical protein
MQVRFNSRIICASIVPVWLILVLAVNKNMPLRHDAEEELAQRSNLLPHPTEQLDCFTGLGCRLMVLVPY